MPSVGSCHDGLTSPEGCEQANEASRASLMLRAATQPAGALKDGLARAGKQSSVADSARRCQREAASFCRTARAVSYRETAARCREGTENAATLEADPRNVAGLFGASNPKSSCRGTTLRRSIWSGSG